MKLQIISIIPIELYTIKHANEFKAYLNSNHIISECNNVIIDLFYEIFPINSNFYKIDHEICPNTMIAFSESGIAIVYENNPLNIILNINNITNICNERKEYHNSFILNNSNNPLHNLFQLFEKFNDMIFRAPEINYVFSLYLIESTEKDIEGKKDLIKILAEPSLIDVDDMLSSSIKDSEIIIAKINNKKINKIKDVDLFSSVETYITWASIVSVIYNKADFVKTKNLLVVLEIRLQIIWNKCFSISLLIDDLLDNKIKMKNSEELYWSFAKTLDDARSVLSSTYSSRARKLFEEMIISSRITGEIERLNLKINMLEKYLENRARKANVKYQRAFQILLFITALASIFPILLPTPLNIRSIYSWIALVSICLIGFFIILKIE